MDFFRLVRQLKVRKRAGWARHDVRHPESIAGAHTYLPPLRLSRIWW